jgi:hypothetical protein
MMVLLRDAGTKEYFRGGGGWTGDPLQAFDFRNTYAAVTTASTSERAWLEVVLSFEDPVYDLVLPAGRRPEGRGRPPGTGD